MPVQIDLFSRSNFYVTPGEKRPSGIFFATAVLLPIGQKVMLDIELHSRTRMELNGEVAWKRSHSSLRQPDAGRHPADRTL